LAGFATLQKDYTYQAGETDNQFTSRALAVEQVKRLLLEELGTYLGRETGAKNSDLTKDQIIALAAGFVKIDIVDERWDGQACYIRAKITADPKEVNRSIESLRQDRRNAKEVIETRKRADGLIKEIERLKTELPRGAGERKENVQQEYNEKVKELSAVDWLEKGKSLAFSRNFRGAVDSYSRAIELSPKEAAFFLNRGAIYEKLGDYQQAIRDFDTGVDLNPKDSLAYFGRGMAFWEMGEQRQAIDDLKNAARLDHKKAQDFLRQKEIGW